MLSEMLQKMENGFGAITLELNGIRAEMLEAFRTAADDREAILGEERRVLAAGAERTGDALELGDGAHDDVTVRLRRGVRGSGGSA